MLPASCAIRTVLVEDPPTGRQTLAAIGAGAWARIASVLDPADAARIVNALADDTADLDGARLFDLSPGIAVELMQCRGFSPEVLGLTLIAAFSRAGLECAVTLIHSAEVLCTLILALQSRTIGESSRLTTVVFDCVPEYVRVAHRATLRELSRRVADLIDPNSQHTPDGPVTTHEVLATPFAGYIVLLDELDALLGNDRMTHALPTIDGEAARGEVALAILACVVGQDRTLWLWQDTAWRLILGINPSPDTFIAALNETGNPGAAWEILTERATALGGTAPATGPGRFGIRDDWRYLTPRRPPKGYPKAWRRFFAAAALFLCRRLARRVPGMSGASIAYLRTNLLTAPGHLQPLHPGRFHLHVSRPPLHVLLSLTGMSRGTRTWRGQQDTSVEIEYGGGVQ
jgi:hypothetical protein